MSIDPELLRAIPVPNVVSTVPADLRTVPELLIVTVPDVREIVALHCTSKTSPAGTLRVAPELVEMSPAFQVAPTANANGLVVQVFVPPLSVNPPFALSCPAPEIAPPPQVVRPPISRLPPPVRIPELRVIDPRIDEAAETENEPPEIIRFWFEFSELMVLVPEENKIVLFPPIEIWASSLTPGKESELQLAGVFQLRSPPPPSQVTKAGARRFSIDSRYGTNDRRRFWTAFLESPIARINGFSRRKTFPDGPNIA